MKKKMTVLCGLLMAVLVTAYSVSGTYAKYTTTGRTSDSARVARWSIKIGETTEDTIKLFSKTYGANNEVKADTLVVAPGTSGSYTFTFDGDAEVAYSLTASATIVKNTVKYSETESPIKFRLKSDSLKTDENPTGTTAWFEVAQLSAKLADVIKSDCPAGNVSSCIDSVTLEWRWAFDATELASMNVPGITIPDKTTDADGFAAFAEELDAKDTALGQTFMKAYINAYNQYISKYIEDHKATYGDSVKDLATLKEYLGAGFSAVDEAADNAGKEAQKAEGVDPEISIEIKITATQIAPTAAPAQP